MKAKHLPYLAIICFIVNMAAQTLNAQIQKGNWLVEGNLGNIVFSNNTQKSGTSPATTTTETRNYAISLYPRLAYLLTDNLALGATLSLGYQQYNFDYYASNALKTFDGKSNSAYAGLSPFLRYYFGKNSKNRFYAQAGAGFSIDLLRKDDSKGYDAAGNITSTNKNTSDGQSFFGQAGIGFHHFFNEKVAFNSFIAYDYGKKTQNTTATATYPAGAPSLQKYSYSYLTGNLVWNFGLTVFLSGKKTD